MIYPVKGQPTVQPCGNGDSSISYEAEIQQLLVEVIRQQQNEQLQYIHDILGASLQQMKNHQETVMISLQAIDRRSQQDFYVKQVQSIHGLLNASHQQLASQHNSVLRRLEAIDRRLNEHDVSITNHTQNSWKISLGKVKRVSSNANVLGSSTSL